MSTFLRTDDRKNNGNIPKQLAGNLNKFTFTLNNKKIKDKKIETPLKMTWSRLAQDRYEWLTKTEAYAHLGEN